MPLLVPGISGFGPVTETGPDDFKRVVYVAARIADAVVEGFVAHDGVTPSFHRASVTFGTKTLSVLCNRYFSVVGFADRLEGASIASFVAAPSRLAEVIAGSGLIVADASELGRRLETADLESLLPEERQQAKYWKPKRIGDIIYNWWD